MLALLASACATGPREWHAAPVYSRIARAGGGVEVEGAGGIWRKRTATIDGQWTQRAVRPIVIHDRTVEGHVLGRFFTPLGTSKDRGEEKMWQLLPITRYDRNVTPNGEVEWTLITLPGIYWAQKADGRTLRGWFPFGGVMEDFLSFDRLTWVLFPIFMRTERDGRVTHHVLFPIFAWTSGRGGWSGRFWPFFGISRYEGRYDRAFYLWPVFTFEHNDIGKGEENEEHRWTVFPLIGRSTRGSYQATTVLWPFFGYADDPKTGFWDWDGPWPLVRVMRSPKQGITNTRVWPFWSHYQGDGLDSTWYAWPFVNVRREEYAEGERNAVAVVPFWQHWKRYEEGAGTSWFQKLWPIYQAEGREGDMRYAFPALNPLWQTPDIDEMYAWIWELYTRERTHGMVRERSWLGLWRREKDDAEDRKSLAFVWSRRKWHDGALAARDTSLLFGLLRWRTREDGAFEFLAPAFPGPGWPLERAPRAASLGAPEPR